MFLNSILKTESFRKGIALSTVLNIFAKGLTFCNTMLIAFYFGTSQETDIYFFIISIVTSISLFITGCTASVIVPEMIHLRENGQKDEVIKITNLILFTFVLITIIPVISFSIAPVQVFSRISQFKSSTIIEHRFYFSISSLLLILITVNTFLKEILSIYRFFTFPMIISMVNSIFTLISIPLLKNCMGMKSVITGLVLGNFVNAVILVLSLRKNAEWHFSQITFRLPGSLLKRMLYAQTGYTATAAGMFVPQYLLSGLSAGVIAALNFGRQISDIPGNFLTAQFASVSGIKFNELMARNQLFEMDQTFRKSLAFLLSILCPACGIIFIFSTEIVELFFGRGAFNAASVSDASVFCRLFILSAPLIALDYLSARILIAAKKIKQSFWYQLGSNLLNIILMVLLFPKIGGKAIPVTLLISYGLNVVAQPIMFHFFCPWIKYVKSLAESSVVLIINVIIVIGIIILNDRLQRYGCISVFRLAAGSALYFSVIYFLNLFLNVNADLQNIIRNINLKIRSVLNF